MSILLVKYPYLLASAFEWGQAPTQDVLGRLGTHTISVALPQHPAVWAAIR